MRGDFSVEVPESKRKTEVSEVLSRAYDVLSHVQFCRAYLVARGGQCIYCKPHNWKAYREPEERDCMQPCILSPIYTVEASNKREAVAEAKRRYAADTSTAREHSQSGER